MFAFDNLTPHGFCLAWDPGLLWLEAGSDILIAAAYYSIPFALMRFTSLRRDLAFSWVFRLFAAFILACGTTHLLGLVTLWEPVYWLDGGIKFVTALLSVTTAVVLWRVLPGALSLPSGRQLQAVNARLSGEVTERRAAEARILANKARLKSMYRRTPAPLCAADCDGLVVEASDQWLELLGYARDEVVGRRLLSFVIDDLREQAALDWAGLWRHGSMRDVEQQLRHRDGSARVVLTSATVEAGPGGVAVSAMMDITGRRETEQALRASEEHLRQAHKMEAVGQLTGGIAHDFNNMLTGIVCVMQVLQRRLPEGDASRRMVGNVLGGAEKAARLTAQLLAFSRRQRLVPEVLDPVEVVELMRELLVQPLGRMIGLEVRPGVGERWLALADRNQLESALLNLVLNAKAALAGVEGGRITIESRAVAGADLVMGGAGFDDEGEVSAARDYVAITVGDNGAGMSEATRERAFEPFFTTKPVGQGTGLGLSQIYGFVRQSGGTVRIESACGVGTRVTLLFPRAPTALSAALPVRQCVPEAVEDGGTVLVVEDEDSLREVVSTLLESRGYRVVAARSGDEAAMLVADGAACDVLFTDIMMPGSRNGIAIARELRERWPGLPVVFTTAGSDHAGLYDGAAVLGKPYSIDAVARRIQAARLRAPV